VESKISQSRGVVNADRWISHWIIQHFPNDSQLRLSIDRFFSITGSRIRLHFTGL